jgi:hypothetical protein
LFDLLGEDRQATDNLGQRTLLSQKTKPLVIYASYANSSTSVNLIKQWLWRAKEEAKHSSSSVVHYASCHFGNSKVFEIAGGYHAHAACKCKVVALLTSGPV